MRLQEALSKRRLDDCLGITNSLQAQLQIMDSQLEERPGCTFDADMWQEELGKIVSSLEKSLHNSAMTAGPVARFRELAEAIKNAGRASERHLLRKAKAWGVEKNMHHARSKALVDKDEVHDNMTMPEDRGAPVFQELDPYWIATFDNLPEIMSGLQKQILDEVKLAVHGFSSKFVFQGSGEPKHGSHTPLPSSSLLDISSVASDHSMATQQHRC